MLVLSAISPAALALGLGDIRLNSTLNAPLDAEIELVNASPEELASLRAQLASRETFARYGLEWPAFLANVTVTRAKSSDGRDVLRVRSSEVVTEPFITLLVDANWGRGRLVREYTMLLDPPVFAPPAPASAPAAAVAVPSTAAPRSGAVQRRTDAAAAPAAPSGSAGDTYTVRRGDTLSAIAARLADGGATSEQAMVAIYRTNPQAFEGSMNDLRAGAVLRVPDAAVQTAESPAAAAAEVRRQGQIWRSRAPAAAAGGEGRLRLVVPTEQAPAGAAGSAAARGEADQLRSRVSQLEAELDSARRMLELRNSELAELQQRLAAVSGAPAPEVAVPPPPVEPAAPVEPAPAEPVAGETGEGVPPVAAAPAEEVPAPMQARPRREAPAEEPSFFAGLLESLKAFWFVPVGLLALIGGLIGYRRWQASREDNLEDTFVSVDSAAREVTHPVAPVVPAAPSVGGDTTKLRRPNIVGREDRGLVVEESGEFEQPRVDPAAARAAQVVSTEDTFSGETGINLDQGDPLAEADFHMAYGLYDQAADLVRLAAAREPARRDLKLKLAEVYFVWGNKDEFLKTARELHDTQAEGAPGEWDKIVIMGKQIAPEDALFAGAIARAGADASVDLRLDEGSSNVDFDFFGDGAGPQLSRSAGAADLDVGPAPGDDEATGEQPTLTTADTATIQVDAGGATTQQMAPNFAATATASAADGLDFDLGDTAARDLGEAPTVEQPALRGTSPDIRAKLDAALRQGQQSDQTAEIALDDLGLDLGDATGLDRPDLTVDMPLGSDGATLVANLDDDGVDLRGETLTAVDDTSRRLMDAASAPTEIAPRPAGLDAGATAALPALRDEAAEAEESSGDTGSTSMIAALDLEKFDLSSLDDTGKTKGPGNGLDFDVGTTTLPGGDAPRAAPARPAPAVPSAGDDELTLPSLEPVTISEVGTKLDLARAYMDMGDPDGARSILREVLSEGSMAQKQEAERLLASLPG
jgi:pilus assembly protein FimV